MKTRTMMNDDYEVTEDELKRLRLGQDPTLRDLMERQKRQQARWLRAARWNGFKSRVKNLCVRLLQQLHVLPPSRAMRGAKYGWWGICETAWNVTPGHGWDRVYSEPADIPEEELYGGSNQIAVYGPFATEAEAREAADPGNIYVEEAE